MWELQKIMHYQNNRDFVLLLQMPSGNGHLSEMFWTFLVTTVVGLVLVISKLCFKSKCHKVVFCCLEVERNNELEHDEKVDV